MSGSDAGYVALAIVIVLIVLGLLKMWYDAGIGSGR